MPFSSRSEYFHRSPDQGSGRIFWTLRKRQNLLTFLQGFYENKYIIKITLITYIYIYVWSISRSLSWIRTTLIVPHVTILSVELQQPKRGSCWTALLWLECVKRPLVAWRLRWETGTRTRSVKRERRKESLTKMRTMRIQPQETRAFLFEINSIQVISNISVKQHIRTHDEVNWQIWTSKVTKICQLSCLMYCGQDSTFSS